jgi:hypothetical protein
VVWQTEVFDEGTNMKTAIDVAPPVEGTEAKICQLFEVSPQALGTVEVSRTNFESIAHLFEIPAESLRTELREERTFLPLE